MQRKDYLITIIADGTKESFLASANSKKEAIKNVKGFNKLLVILLIIPGYMKAKRF